MAKQELQKDPTQAMIRQLVGKTPDYDPDLPFEQRMRALWPEQELFGQFDEEGTEVIEGLGGGSAETDGSTT